MQEIKLNVTGMSCSHCERAVLNALKSLQGIINVEVSQKEGRANVSFDPQKVNTDQIIDAVNSLGAYSATLS